jgi:hypothetical protein
MAKRVAACDCAQLRLEVAGDPMRVVVCHCLACQRRTGSPFVVEGKFRSDQVDVIGRFSDYTRASDGGGEATYHFCPECGVSVFNTTTTDSDVWVPIGAFADPSFPPPRCPFLSHGGIRGWSCRIPLRPTLIDERGRCYAWRESSS